MIKNTFKLKLYETYFLLGLNTFLVLIFVVFVADGPLKMVLIFTECLEWSSFLQFVFYLVLLCNVV